MALARQAVASTSQVVRRVTARKASTLCPVCYAKAPQYARQWPRAQSTSTNAEAVAADDAPAMLQRDTAPLGMPESRVEPSKATRETKNDEEGNLEEGSAEPSSAPTLEDFYALCPENLRMPRDVDSVDTPEFAVYERRYGEMIASLEKAFNRAQVVDFHREVGTFKRPVKTMGKRAMIKKIVSEKVGYKDPAEYREVEKRRQEAAGREALKVSEEISINETELFFLLGKLAGSDASKATTLLQNLQSACAVKATIKGNPPNSLEVVGLPEDIQKFRQRWADVQLGVTSTELETRSRDGLRADLYKPLSMATDTFISPGNKNKTVTVTYRSDKLPRTQLSPPERVQRMLAALAKHDKIQLNTPRFYLSASQADAQDHALLPFLPQNAPIWHLASLPSFGLSRLSYMLGGIQDNEAQIRESEQLPDPKYVPTTGGAIPGKIFAQLAEHAKDIHVRAELGHHLFIDPLAGSSTIEVDTAGGLLKRRSKAPSAFIPSPPPGLQGLLGGWLPPHVRSAIKLSTDYIRRTLYLPVDASASSAYVQLERPMPGPKELARTPEEMQEDRWSMQVGRRSLADVYVPEAFVDYRLIADTRQDGPKDVLEKFADIVRQPVPDKLTVDGVEYELYEDLDIRRTTVEEGLSVPWADLSKHTITLERRTDRIHQRVKTTAVTVTARDGRQGLDALMEQLKGLRSITSEPSLRLPARGT